MLSIIANIIYDFRKINYVGGINNRHAYALFLVFAVIFLIVAFKGLKTAQPGDENTYYFMGKLISEGKVPYKDFFLAHPPLHVYIVALFYNIFGFNIVILKLIPLALTFASAFLVFLIAKEKFGNAAAILSSALFLFSYSIMFDSVFSFGIEFSIFFIILGTYSLLIENNYIVSGLLFGLAGITRLLSLVPIAVILAYLLFSDSKKFLKILSIFLIVFLSTNAIFSLMFGGDYLVPVYKFHLLKNPQYKENFKEYFEVIKLNWVLFVSAAAFLLVKEKKPISMFASISLIYLAFMLVLRQFFAFYITIAFPFLALVGGYSIAKLFQYDMTTKLKIVVAAVFFLAFGWNLLSDSLFLQSTGFTGFDRGNDLVELINSKSNKDTLLFGDNSVVPLLALLTNKPIALDLVDTNNEVFLSGLKNIKAELDNLRGKDILFIVRSRQGISSFSEVRKFLNNNCDLLSSFHDRIEGDYLVYRCK